MCDLDRLFPSEENVAWILHIFEEKRLCRHRITCLAAVLTLDDAAELFDRDLAFAHLQHSADNGADHVAEEAIGLDGEDVQRAFFLPMCLHDLADVCLDVGMQFGKGGEVAVEEELLPASVP